ncbi:MULTISPECIES: non-ribosomal peptide synthetase [unclassified Ruegeria]|uniref:non-ribosomal peptide synthetase n=1 Tax=unclassified Ruegeria TaxID=2625375 RepID=UPI001489FF13|nr:MULTISPECIES: non-ribosomal peptide synthetase [unclassified Ruegeria]
MRNLTNAQNLFWVGHKTAPKAGHLNQAIYAVFSDVEDANRLVSAIHETAAECDSFRLTFEESDDTVRQHATARAPVCQRIGVTDLDAAMMWMQTDARVPFDLENGTSRMAFISLADGRHIFYLVQHHMVCDGASVSLFMQRVADRFNGEELSLQPAFLDCNTLFQSKSETAASLDNADNPPLSLYGKEGGQGGHEKISHFLELDTNQLKSFEQAVSKAPFQLLTSLMSTQILLTTVVFAWLSRITGSERIALSVPQHNRTTPELRRVVGLVMEMLPLSVEVNKEDTLTTLHAKVLDATRGLILKGGSGTTKPSLVRNLNVVLNVFSGVPAKFKGADCVAKILPVERSDPFQDLNIEFADLNATGEFTARIVFDAKQFSEVERELAAQHFRRMLDASLQEPDQKLSQIDILTKPERDSIRAFNTTAAASTQTPTVLEPLLATDRDLPAVRSHSDQELLNYGALIDRSNQLAHSLVASGVGVGDRVVVHLPRSPDAIVAILATLFAGAAFVPVDYNMPVERRSAILADVQAAAIITTEERQNDFDGVVLTTQASDMPLTATNCDVLPETPAYVIYTSGSTGTPKGVVVRHRELAEYIATIRQSYPVEDGWSYALFSAIGFDLTINSIFLPLVTGGQIVTYAEPAEGPDLAVLDVFRDDKVDFARPTPSHLNLVLDADIGPVDRIKCMPLSGEAFPRELADRALEQLGKRINLINEYGPTEAVVGAMMHHFQPDDPPEYSVSLGRPAPGMAVSVVNEAGRDQPFGVVGEIAISGRLASGYLGRHDLTDQRFVDGLKGDDQRWYLTGDAGAWSKEGALVYLGRLDDQVKINGVRIELGEIEHIAQTHPDVSQAVASVQTINSRQILALHFVGGASAEDVKNIVNRSLPAQVHVDFALQIDAIPMSANGKISRKDLPRIGADALQRSTSGVLPRTSIETHLSKIWADVLDHRPIFVDQAFSELGGDSLAAIRILSSARKENLDFEIADLFRAQTIERLAELVTPLHLAENPEPRERFAGISAADRKAIELAIGKSRI